MEQEMHSSDAWNLTVWLSATGRRSILHSNRDLQSIDTFAIVLRAEQQFHFGNGEKGAKPLILVFVANEKAHIRIWRALSF